ncbi:MAG: hypothetical protein HY698_07295 [Deltaproteobacteria bacterium]|nr:hypothetical protein [Deltaproteobacteria bacterium]
MPEAKDALDATTLLDRLRAQSEDGPLSGLATVIIDHAMSKQASRLVNPRDASVAIVSALRTAVRSDELNAFLLQATRDLLAVVEKHAGPIEHLAPEELGAALRRIVALPYSPDPGLVLKLLQREPVRKLLRDLLLDSLLGFAKKLRSPMEGTGLGRGLGGLSKLAAEQIKARTGTLGVFASGVASAVSQEVERQVEQRATDFADSTLSSLIGQLAEQLSDPGRAGEQAALRLALLEGLLALHGREVAAEISAGNPDLISRTIRDGLRAWSDKDSAVDDVERGLAAVLAHLGNQSLGDLLVRLHLEPVIPVLRPLLVEELRGIVGSDAFAAWMKSLFSNS